MPLNWKRIALLIAFIAAVFVFGYLLYYLFLKPAIPAGPAAVNVNAGPGVLPQAGANANIPLAGNINGALPGEQKPAPLGPPAELPPAAAAASPTANGGLTKITALTAAAAGKPALASDGVNVIYYNRATGKFYKVFPDGRTVPVSEEVFYQVQNVSWSPDKNKAVLEYPDGANIVYDFNQNKQITLPRHWKDFSFSPDSGQLVFKSLGDSPESRWLAVVNADGTKAVKIEPLGDKDATVYPRWSPAGQIVAMYREAKGLDSQNLYFLGLNKENLKSTIIEGQNFQGQWSTKGDRLLYSVSSGAAGFKPTLWIVEAQGESIGQNRKNLGLETWSDKCGFADNDTVYCAVPQTLAEGAGIFSAEMDNSPSDLYKIDLKSGFKSKIAVPEGSHNISQVIVSENESYLYFTSQTDGKLYKINLR